MATEASASASVAITVASVRGPNPESANIRGQRQPKQSGLTQRHDSLGRESPRLIVLPSGRRQHATGDLPRFQNGRVMSHEISCHSQIHPQIYWIEPALSPRMRGVVKQSRAAARPQTFSDDFMHFTTGCTCLRSHVYSEDSTEGKHYRNAPRATTDVNVTHAPFSLLPHGGIRSVRSPLGRFE